MIRNKSVTVTASALLILATSAGPIAGAAADGHHRRLHRHHHAAAADPALGPRQAAPGATQNPNGGFVINNLGYGNYTSGPSGGFGGYPPGSAGAEELQNNQRYKCDYLPESC